MTIVNIEPELHKQLNIFKAEHEFRSLNDAIQKLYDERKNEVKI